MIISTRCAIQSTDVKHKENKMKTYIMACVLVVAAASYNSAIAVAKCDQTYIDCYEKCLSDKKCQSEKNKYQKDFCGGECMYDCEEYRACLK